MTIILTIMMMMMMVFHSHYRFCEVNRSHDVIRKHKNTTNPESHADCV